MPKKSVSGTHEYTKNCDICYKWNSSALRTFFSVRSKIFSTSAHFTGGLLRILYGRFTCSRILKISRALQSRDSQKEGRHVLIDLKITRKHFYFLPLRFSKSPLPNARFRVFIKLYILATLGNTYSA